MTAILEALVVDGLVTERSALSDFTTYKFGGPARWLAEVGDSSSLDRVVEAVTDQPDLEVAVVGRGSNLVVSDRGFDGLVLRLVGGFLDVAIEDDLVVAGGAAPLPRVAREAVKAGRGGLEFYVGIPGSVGGAVRMNAGCHGTETDEVLVAADVVNIRSGERSTRTPAELEMAYRHSNLQPDEMVVSARFQTSDQTSEVGERRLREITQWRKENQPGGTFNAGSVFKNPPDDHAGRIIDELGLKGLQIGGASVSERHANFFVAEPDTSAQNIHDLVAEVRRRVAEATGVTLEPEIMFIGDFS